MKKREEKSQSEKSVQAEMTMLGAIEQIAMSAEDSAFERRFLYQIEFMHPVSVSSPNVC